MHIAELPSFGHQKMMLDIDPRLQIIRVGDRNLAYHSTGFEQPPKGVSSIETLQFNDMEIARLMDAAILTVKERDQIDVEKFTGQRLFTDKLVSGKGLWLGYNRFTGESLSYGPQTTEINRDNPDSGIIAYGYGWTSTWVNLGSDPLVILEVCTPPYQDDGTVEYPGTFNHPILDTLRVQ